MILTLTWVQNTMVNFSKDSILLINFEMSIQGWSSGFGPTTFKLYLLNFKQIEENILGCQSLQNIIFLVGWLVGFYGISTFIDYLTPNPFLCK